ncbi:MAG: hypothetical protein MJA28_13320 [Gammaproteobacteria bacterium]|nr:hypothetical protein [Gammaproteobacteria bacterium]
MRLNIYPVLSFFLFSALIAGMSACAPVDSDDVKTSGMRAAFTVEANGDGKSYVEAELTLGDSSFTNSLELVNGDALLATANGETKLMREDKKLFSDITYKVDFPIDTENTAFKIALDRPDGKNAPNSSVTLPAPVTITSPAAGATFHRDDMLTLSWTPASNNMTELQIGHVSSRCTDTLGEQVITSTKVNDALLSSDPGSIERQASVFLPPFTRQDPQASCVVDIEVRRRRIGTVDPNIGEGGYFYADWYDWVQVTILP